MSSKKLIVISFTILSILSSCAPTRDTGSTYDTYEMGEVSTVTKGKIISMRNVKIEGQQGGVGTLSGAVAGGALGSNVGGNTSTNVAGAVAGAVIGGLAGVAADKALNNDKATEFIIEQDDAKMISLVQTNEENLHVGEKVLVITKTIRTNRENRPYSASVRITRDYSLPTQNTIASPSKK